MGTSQGCTYIVYVLIAPTSTNAAVYKITVGHRSISDYFAEVTAQIVAWMALPSDRIFSLCNQADPTPRSGPPEASKSQEKLSCI